MDHQQSMHINDPTSDMPRRERIKRQQRGEILDAALKLFSEKGYHSVSMHEIAREAQFGIGTLYKFFSNKEDLYKALLMGMATKWHHYLLDVLNRQGNILETIQEFITLRVNLFAENSTIMRLYFAETSGASFNVRAGLEEDLLELYDEGISKLASLFEQGVQQKIFRPMDPQNMALALDGIINAFLFRSLEDPARFKHSDDLSTAADIFFNGILAGKPPE